MEIVFRSISFFKSDIFLQVQEKNGETLRYLKTEGGDTVRLVVSWYMGYLACNNEGSPNKVRVGADGVNDASAEEEQINNILTTINYHY